MNLIDAQQALNNGKKVKRAHWSKHWEMKRVPVGMDHSNDSMSAVIMSDVILSISNDGTYAPATAHRDDVNADDWEVIGE